MKSGETRSMSNHAQGSMKKRSFTSQNSKTKKKKTNGA